MFFAVFIAIYGLLNYYVYSTIAPVVGNYSPTVEWAFAVLFLSVFAGKVLESRGPLRAALPLIRIGYGWLGFVGIAASLALVVDFLQLLIPTLDNRQAGVLVLFLSLAAAAWGSISARRPRIKTIELKSPKLEGSPGRPVIRIAQISDFHLGDGSSIGYTRLVVSKLQSLSPDIIVSTGDLFDGCLPLLGPHVSLLGNLDARLGKFAVCGNHDVYADVDQTLALTRRAGFTVLRNQAISLEDNLTIAGVEDPASPLKPDESILADEKVAQTYTLLLKHRPDIDPNSVGRFDLQLSGHTHGGQIFPFHFLVKLSYRAKVGLSEIGPRQYRYLSRGVGSWGPQMRLFAPPEITLFILRGETRSGEQ